MTAGDHLGQQFLDLYHHTSPENADQIKKTGSFNTRTYDLAYFTTHKGSEYASAFGPAAVHVRVPSHMAELDDEFPSGEQHYTVPVKKIRPQHIVSD